ncbi:MAG: type IV secretion system DNA-binding domain-containing protein [Bacteroidota bacterium]
MHCLWQAKLWTYYPLMNNGENKVTPIAVTNWRDIRKKFGIKEKNRRGHMYVVGKTGTGKSSLLGNMLISDISQGNGVALIDPHGDLAETMLRFIPPNRVNDVIYLNPGDLEHPFAFNPLRKVDRDYRHLVVSGLLSVFRKIWREFWGPRLEHLLRHALFSLLDYPGSTLLDVTRIFTDSPFRLKVISCITEEVIKAFWLNEFDKYSPWLRSEAVSPILNKMGQFLTNLPLRNIVGQRDNTFSLRKAMDEGKIVIANLSKGAIGEDNCALLGAMLVTQIQLAALSRANIPEGKRRPFYLYVDEVHTFLTESFADMLAEARKYGLNLVLAHQYVAQLKEELRNAVFGNVGTIISFRVGADDANHLAREFAPVFEEADFVNLPNYHIYLKLMIDGVTSEPFSATTMPLPGKGISNRDEIVKESQRKHGGVRKEVEQAIFARYRTEGTSTSAQKRLF